MIRKYMTTMAHTCLSCNKTLSTKQRLVFHLGTSERCKTSEKGREQLQQLTAESPRKRFYCPRCSKRFVRNSDRKRHLFRVHGVRFEGESSASEVAELREQIQELTERVDNLPPASNTYIQNIQNNVHINGLGREDLSRVTGEVLTHCLKNLPKGNRGILDLVNLIHFETHGNKNVRVVEGDRSGMVLSYYDAETEKWIIDDKRKVLQRMISGPHSLLNNHFETNSRNFESELTSALYNFLVFWFRQTRNKRSPTFEDIMKRLHALIKQMEDRVLSDLSEVETADDDADTEVNGSSSVMNARDG